METIKRINEKEVEIDGIKYLKSKAEFKVGQWVSRGKKQCYRIVAFDENNWPIAFNTLGMKTFLNPDVYRLATHSEIEQHLIAVAKEKGYVKGKKIICVNYPNRGEFVLSGNFMYYDDYDKLLDEDSYDNREGMSIPAIYSNGKWAEILPSKKKLPKTKEEFSTFLGHWNSRHTKSTEEFLNQYE